MSIVVNYCCQVLLSIIVVNYCPSFSIVDNHFQLLSISFNCNQNLKPRKQPKTFHQLTLCYQALILSKLPQTTNNLPATSNEPILMPFSSQVFVNLQNQQLSIVVNSCQQLSIAVNRCQQLSIAVNSCQSFSTVVNSCLQLSIVVYCCQSFSTVVNSCQQLSTVVYSCLLLSIIFNCFAKI